MTQIILLVPHLSKNDAVGNDIMLSHQHLNEAGFATSIYARSWDDGLNSLLMSKNDFIHRIKQASTLVIYHHCVYFPEYQDLMEPAQCRVWLKYHNVTPAAFYKPYDYGATLATQAGRAQIEQLIAQKAFTQFVSDSSYNSEEVIKMGAEQAGCHVIAPYVRLQDFDHCHEVEAITNRLQNGKYNILFVGRVVPNKGHLHLLKTLKQFVAYYGPEAKLWIVGTLVPSLVKYYRELEQYINDNGLGACVEFVSGANFSSLNTFYKKADVFLLMSEHEGFCVPILEAQYHQLPIVGVSRCAVGETLGIGQIQLNEFDYQFAASALAVVRSNAAVRSDLVAHGLKNIEHYREDAITKQWVNLLHRLRFD